MNNANNPRYASACWYYNESCIGGFIETTDMVDFSFSFREHRDPNEKDVSVVETMNTIMSFIPVDFSKTIRKTHIDPVCTGRDPIFYKCNMHIYCDHNNAVTLCVSGRNERDCLIMIDRLLRAISSQLKAAQWRGEV